jgi:hypothetical protein
MAVDCAFNTETATGVVSRVNPDPSCECVGNTAPLAPGGPTPQDGHDLISIFTGLSWQAFDVDGDITGFDLYFGTSTHPPLVASNLPSPSYTPATPLDEWTQHFWRVVVRDAHGEETSGPEWTFTTRSANAPPS